MRLINGKTKLEHLLETIQLVQDKVIDAHPLFLETPLDELLEICNGCGAKDSRLPVPQTIWGMNNRPACNPHDFGYHIGTTIEHKKEEDRRMLNNSIRLIDRGAGGLVRILRVKRAVKYYLAVDLCGGPAFWNIEDSK